ncbi:uncharacterized protein LOC143182577 [Calliopsis andreniformis]|uniref:uncharacterized protein LOC143182577 n=1 Tax=Calliopsis andreniformis TaxID=337506 RepID=UPI003FCE6235
MPYVTKTKIGKSHAGTQTYDTDTMLEIARLQEQVKLLEIENKGLKKYAERLCKNVTPPTPSAILTSTEKTPTVYKSMQKHLQTQSTQKSNGKTVVSRCNCKKDCANNRCGCVKRNVPCGESCGCTSVCQNQKGKDKEENKENVGNDGLIHMKSVKATASKSLFSPNMTTHKSTPNIEQCKPMSLYFGSPKQLIFDSDEEEKENEVEDKNMEKTLIESDKSKEKYITKRGNRSKKANIEANNSENHEKTKSTLNEDKLEQINTRTKKRALRKYNFTGIEDQTYQEVKQTNSIKETRSTVDNKAVESNIKGMSQSTTIEVQRSLGQGSNLNEKELHDVVTEECNFNPMKPKHELPRTPIRDGNDISADNTSNTPVVVSIITQEEDIPVPAELNEPQVNWDEYQSQLVACGKCKRKFHPFRIKKHESCCKKI